MNELDRPRQRLLKGWNQDAISDTSVAVVGGGAIGSQAAVCCARMGVGKMLLIDADHLERHNLANQEYDASDLGKAKVTALKERIRRIDPSIKVRAWVGKVQDYRGDWDVDYILGGLDNATARYKLNGIGVRTSTPLIDAGIDGYRGHVMTVMSGKTACYVCEPLLPNEPVRPGCSENPIPSTYVTASQAADLQVTQLIKALHGKPLKSFLQFDLERDLLLGWDLPPNPQCQTCGGEE